VTRHGEQKSPDHLREIEAELAALRFEPRSSLGPELLGRYRHGERAAPAAAPRIIRWARRHQRMLGLAAGLVVMTGLAARGVLGPLARATLVDHCCVDLDGQETEDDGLLVESIGGEEVRTLTVYEDLDGDGRYSPGDRITFTRRGAPTLAPPAGDGLKARRFCCVDYDGGGPADDGLLVVNGPGGGIVLAAIYETSRAATRGGLLQPLLR